jgi:hypothetical protein
VEGEVNVPDGEDVVVVEMGAFLSLELPPERVHMVATDKAVRAMRDTIFGFIGENQHVDCSSRFGVVVPTSQLSNIPNVTARRLNIFLSNCNLLHCLEQRSLLHTILSNCSLLHTFLSNLASYT